MSTINVLIADDIATTREDIKACFILKKTYSDWEAEDGEEAIVLAGSLILM